MTEPLFVSNLSPDITEDQLRELFADSGVIAEVTLVPPKPDSQWPHAALVTMQDDESADAVRRQFNGYELDERRLAVTWAEARDDAPLTQEMREVAKQIGDQLGEPTEARPRLERVVRWGGIAFAQALVEETLQIEAAGGMTTHDGSRQRTPGGVFFYLARGRISPQARRAMFYLRKRSTTAKPKKAKTPKKPAPAPPSVVSPDRNAPPQTPKELSPDIVAEFAALREALAEAQQNLETIRENPAQRSGAFATMKTVVELKKQVDALLRQYPGLADS